ncbi:hypothetical protein SANTM175S_07682 [Streptomyces antimycoticus]
MAGEGMWRAVDRDEGRRATPAWRRAADSSPSSSTAVHTAGNSSRSPTARARCSRHSKRMAWRARSCAPAPASATQALRRTPDPRCHLERPDRRPRRWAGRTTLLDSIGRATNRRRSAGGASWAAGSEPDPAKVNVNGGAIALEDPAGAPGRVIATARIGRSARSKCGRADHDLRGWGVGDAGDHRACCRGRSRARGRRGGGVEADRPARGRLRPSGSRQRMTGSAGRRCRPLVVLDEPESLGTGRGMKRSPHRLENSLTGALTGLSAWTGTSLAASAATRRRGGQADVTSLPSARSGAAGRARAVLGKPPARRGSVRKRPRASLRRSAATCPPARRRRRPHRSAAASPAACSVPAEKARGTKIVGSPLPANAPREASNRYGEDDSTSASARPSGVWANEPGYEVLPAGAAGARPRHAQGLSVVGRHGE